MRFFCNPKPFCLNRSEDRLRDDLSNILLVSAEQPKHIPLRFDYRS